jgi:hypothetical protein
MLFLRKTAILKKELEYERIDGPTLRLLTTLSSHSLIFHTDEIDVANVMSFGINTFNRMMIRPGLNSNLRALYMIVLLLA